MTNQLIKHAEINVDNQIKNRRENFEMPRAAQRIPEAYHTDRRGVSEHARGQIEVRSRFFSVSWYRLRFYP